MSISVKSIKILWAASAGRCAFPDCNVSLTYSDAAEFAPHTLGEMAHICGDQAGSNRHIPDQTAQERDDYSNLILLCPNHHRLIDRKENEKRFPAEWLLRTKEDYEAQVNARLTDKAGAAKTAIAAEIVPLLAENH